MKIYFGFTFQNIAKNYKTFFFFSKAVRLHKTKYLTMPSLKRQPSPFAPMKIMHKVKMRNIPTINKNKITETDESNIPRKSNPRQ